jgi:hypothetical protein
MEIISFSYIDLPKLRPLNTLLVKVRGQPYCVRTAPKLVLEASDCTKKVLLKSRSTRIGLVHMDHFKYVKSFSAEGVQ